MAKASINICNINVDSIHSAFESSFRLAHHFVIMLLILVGILVSVLLLLGGLPNEEATCQASMKM